MTLTIIYPNQTKSTIS